MLLRSKLWPAIVLIAACIAGFASGGCSVLSPESIEPKHCNLPSNLTRDGEPQIERGKSRPLIDAFGWVWGIPTKILLWNRKVENHKVSPETQQSIENYLADNQLDEIKVRINQYRPIDDWRRLTRHTGVAWPWRYTFGTVSVLGETVFPGRLFGGDHYNPYTGTIHLYSDLASIAIHEGGHAKDFARRTYPGTYAAVYVLPIVPLWHERIATNDALSYIEMHGDQSTQKEAYHVLYPAYGTYIGSAMSNVYPPWGAPLYFGGLISGHVIGRWETSNWDPTRTAAHVPLPPEEPSVVPANASLVQ